VGLGRDSMAAKVVIVGGGVVRLQLLWGGEACLAAVLCVSLRANRCLQGWERGSLFGRPGVGGGPVLLGGGGSDADPDQLVNVGVAGDWSSMLCPVTVYSSRHVQEPGRRSLIGACLSGRHPGSEPERDAPRLPWCGTVFLAQVGKS